MAVTTPATFGDFLRFLRKRAGLTGRFGGGCWLPASSFISTLEGGQRRPDLTRSGALCQRCLSQNRPRAPVNYWRSGAQRSR
jgi:hypothetical protein